tara:strand:- start:2511 stop:3119 length:609 start_codon:yes stop_codon:yes gene_type:complete
MLATWAPQAFGDRLVPFFSFLDDDSGMRDIAQHDRERFIHLYKFCHAVMRDPSPFSDAEKEFIAAYVSGVNACQWCHGAHSVTAQALGADEAALKKSLEDLDSAPIDERLKPVLRYVEKLTLTPSRVTEKDIEEVRNAGWEEDVIQDAILICAVFNCYNRIVDGYGVKGRRDLYDLHGARIAEGGYASMSKIEASECSATSA